MNRFPPLHFLAMFATALWLGQAAVKSPSAQAHARFLPTGSLPSLRNTSTGNKTGPCGPGARNASPTVLTAGQKLKIDWEEVIDHPGWYRIAFAKSGDQGYDDNVLVDKLTDMQGGDINTHKYSTTITVPSTPCTGCTFQLIQYMTENTPPSLYYSCADIEIRSATPAPSPSPSPAPTPSPSPKVSPTPSPVSSPSPKASPPQPSPEPSPTGTPDPTPTPSPTQSGEVCD
jgi:hypothetical protein